MAMSKELSDDPLRELAEVVRELHRAAGMPSTRAVAAASGSISHDSVHRVLKCDRTGRVPRWPTVRAVVEALGGDVDHVLSLWSTAARAETSDKPLGRNEPVVDHVRRSSRAMTDGGIVSPVESDDTPSVDAANSRRSETRLGMLFGDNLAWFMKNGVQRRYPPDALLTREGERCAMVSVVVEGWVKRFQHSRSGTARLVDMHTTGELLSVEAAVLDDFQQYTIASAGEVITVTVAIDRFTERLARDPFLARAVSQALALRLKRESAWHTDTTALPSVQRMAKALVALVETHVVPNVPDDTSATQWTLPYPMSQSEFASLIGSSVISVQRGLRDLRREGLLTMGYRRLTVTDLPGLRQIASSGDYSSTSAGASDRPR